MAQRPVEFQIDYGHHMPYVLTNYVLIVRRPINDRTLVVGGVWQHAIQAGGNGQGLLSALPGGKVGLASVSYDTVLTCDRLALDCERVTLSCSVVPRCPQAQSSVDCPQFAPDELE